MDNELTMQQEILAIAKELSRARQSEESVLEKLCEAACAEVRGRLREGIDEEDCAAAFTCACAWLAAAGLLAARGGGEEIASLRAGDVSVTTRTGNECGESAGCLRRQAWELMAPYVTDSGFCFCGVQG